MPITEAERRFIDEVSLELPWGLVEEFATMPRWQPEDVNRGAREDAIAESSGLPSSRSSQSFDSAIGVGDRRQRHLPCQAAILRVPGA